MNTIQEDEGERLEPDQMVRPALRLHVNEVVKERGWSLEYLRQVAGVHDYEIQRLGAESYYQAVEPLLRVALALDVRIEDLFDAELRGDLGDEIGIRRRQLAGVRPAA